MASVILPGSGVPDAVLDPSRSAALTVAARRTPVGFKPAPRTPTIAT